MIVEIDDPADERLDPYRGLRDADHRRAYENAAGVFVVEGERALVRLLEGGWPVESLLLLRAKAERLAAQVASAAASGATVYVARREAFDAVAGFPVHRGVLALARRPPQREAMALARVARRVLVVEGVNDHENLGSLFRNSAAFGVDAVLLDPTSCDPLYRRSVRVSVGHVLRIPFAVLRPWPAGLEMLAGAGLPLVALTPGGSVELDEAAALLDGRFALMVGSEGEGLSAPALEAATLTVRIPMASGADSLNVATAAAVALSRFVPRPDV